MKKTTLLMVFVSAIIFISCFNNKTNHSLANPTAFEKLQQEQNIQLVDVRTSTEFKSGHLKNAVNIDINNDNFKDELSKLNKEQPLLVYCKSGGRSARAAAIATEMGFKVTDLDGGITAWKSDDKPVVE